MAFSRKSGRAIPWGGASAALGILILLALVGAAAAQALWPDIDYGEPPPDWLWAALDDLDAGGYWVHHEFQNTGRTHDSYEEVIWEGAGLFVQYPDTVFLSNFAALATEGRLPGPYKTYPELNAMYVGLECARGDGTAIAPAMEVSEGFFHGFPATVVTFECSYPGYDTGETVSYDDPRTTFEGGHTTIKRWTCFEITPDGPCTLITENVSLYGNIAFFGDNPERPFVNDLLAEIDSWKARWTITAPGGAPQPAAPESQPGVVGPQPGVVAPQPIIPDPPKTNWLPLALGGLVVVGAAGGAVVVGGVVVRGLIRRKKSTTAPDGELIHRGSVDLKPRLAAGPSSAAGQAPPGPAAPPAGQPSPGIYGQGTAEDPYRDAAAFKINPDGTVGYYPENVGQPPRIHGRGTRDDPYRNHSPGAQPPAAVTPAPPQTAGRKTQTPPPPGKKAQSVKKPPLKSYYLTASASQLTLAGGDRQSIQVEAWESAAGQPPVPCPANLQISAPPQSGLTASPDTGHSRIQCTVSADRSARAGNHILLVQGTAPDGKVMQAGIQVTVLANQYELRCDRPNFELRPGEVREIELALWRLTPGGGQELVPDLPIELDPLGADNPLVTDPPRGSGQFKCKVSVRRGAEAKPSYLQARARPPDADALELMISVRVLPPPSLVVSFDKPVWEPNTCVDLYTLEGQDPQALDQLAARGGKVIVRAWGEYRGAKETIRCSMPIEDGTCALERSGRRYPAVWEPNDYAYTIQVPPAQVGGAPDSSPAQEVKAHIAVPVNRQHTEILNQLLKSAQKAGNALGSPIHEQAERYVHAYMEQIAQEKARELAHRSRDISTWLFHTAAFTRYSAESISAFNLALKLHASAYRRFFDAIINFFLEFLFLMIEKIGGALWQRYVSRGKAAVTETVEAQAKQSIEEVLESEARVLAQQSETLEQELRQATQESTQSQLIKQTREGALVQAEQQLEAIQRQLTQEQAQLAAQRQALAEAGDEAAERAARQQMEAAEQRIKQLQAQLAEGSLARQTITDTVSALEAEINRKVLAIQKLTAELQGANAQLSTLKELQQGVRSSTDMKGISHVLQNPKPGQAALSPELKEALDAFVSEHWKQLDDVIRYLEANRHQLENADALIGRARAMQLRLRQELALDTIKMTQHDLIIKPELQQKLRELNEANARVRSSAPAAAPATAPAAAPSPPYRAMKREDYPDGLFGWAFFAMDKSLEYLYPMHDWARSLMPTLAWTEDGLGWILETMLTYLTMLSNWMINIGHHPEAVRSVIAPDLRKTGIAKAQALGLRAEFFRFPESALAALGHSLSPTGLTGGYTSRAAMLPALKAGAEGGYENERALQQREAFAYFETTLIRAMSHDFESAPNDPTRGVSRSMPHRLNPILQTMDEYLQGFGAAGAAGAEALTAMPARLWEAREWTAQDLEALVEWFVWGLESVAVLVGTLAMLSGVGAPAGAAILNGASKVSQVGAFLRVGVIAFWTMPNVLGFQFDLIAAHALLFDVLYDGLAETLDNLIVERYDAGLSGGFAPGHFGPISP